MWRAEYLAIDLGIARLSGQLVVRLGEPDALVLSLVFQKRFPKISSSISSFGHHEFVKTPWSSSGAVASWCLAQSFMAGSLERLGAREELS